MPAAAPTLAVVGLGKAGGSLVASARTFGVDVVAQARRLPAALKSRAFFDADIIALAVPDDAVEGVAADLARALAGSKASAPPSARRRIVVHLSGAKGPSALAALAAQQTGANPSARARGGGTRVIRGCFHPLAVERGERAIPKGTLVAVDATDDKATRTLAALARRFQCEPARVTEEKRALYHAGAVVAGNLPVALLSMGVTLLVDAGVSRDLARRSLARLLESQARNAITSDLDRALTGPVARGDAGTLARHLDALARGHADIAEIYRALSRALVVDVTAKKHDAKVRAALLRALGAERRK